MTKNKDSIDNIEEGEGGNDKDPLDVEYIPLMLTPDELYSMIQILSFSREIFEQLAITSEKDGKEQARALYAARAQLSSLLYDRLKSVSRAEEPVSRTLH